MVRKVKTKKRSCSSSENENEKKESSRHIRLLPLLLQDMVVV
jgi:hypothetical protein